MPLDLQPILDLQTLQSNPVPSNAGQEMGQEQLAQQSSQQSLVDKISNSPVVTGINALGGGIEQGMANSIGQAIGSPSTTATLSPPSIVQDAMNADPTTALVGKGIGYVGSAAAATAGASAYVGAIGATGLLNTVAANTIAGGVLAGDTNRLKGSLIGAASTAVAPIIGSVSSYMTNALSIGSKIKNVVGNITNQIKGNPAEIVTKSQANMWNVASQTEKQMADSFKSSSISTLPVNASQQAANILAKYNDPKQLGNLTNEQEQTLKQIVNWSKPQTVTNPSTVSIGKDGYKTIIPGSVSTVDPQPFSFDQLHSARKSLDQLINQAFTKVENGEISKDLAVSLHSLRDPLEQDLQTAAEKANVLPQYKAFNDFYKNTILPLMNTGAKDTFDVVNNAGTRPMDYDKLVDTLVNKYVNPNKPLQAQEFLNTLDPVGRQAIEVHTINKILSKVTPSIGTIDASSFKANVTNLQNSVSGIFSDNSNKLLNGLNTSINEATHLAGVPLELNKIGAGYKLSGIVGAIGAIGYHAGAGAAGIAGIVAAGTLKLLQSKVGQGLLIQAGSPGGKAVGRELVNGLLIQSGITADQIGNQ